MKRNVYYKGGGQPRKLPIKIALIMKLTGIMLLAACMQVSAAAYSQKITLSEKNSSLEKVFRKIMKQSDYMFLYNNELLEKAKSVSIDVTSESIDNVLHACFNGQPVTYAIFDKTVVVKPRAVTNMNVAPLPPIRVTGKVTDNTNLPVPGVSVLLKNTNVTVVTDANGLFAITVPEDNIAGGTLVFSSIGFQKQEVSISNNTQINVKLEPEIQALNEVVVVGYGTQRRGDISSAISSVNVEKLKDVPATNLSGALQGRVPGLVSSPSSFRPGSGSNIRIRGNRSLTAGNDPLYVVDGVPITYSIDDLNPLDIESIDIQKDAAATAIYGSRGANGVIQITTKKGKTGKVNVEYSGNSSVEQILRKVDVYDGPEFTQFRRDAFIGSGVYNATAAAANVNKRYYPDPASDYTLFKSTDNALWNNVKNAYTFTQLDESKNIFVAQMRPTTAEEKAVMQKLGYPVLNEVAVYDPSKITTFDWSKDALQNGLTQNHNISVRSGSEKFSSTFSGGYFNQRGINPGQDYTRYSVGVNTNFKPTNFINVGSNINYSNALQNLGPDVYSVAIGQFPLARPYDANGNFIFNPGGDDQVANPLNDPKTVFNEHRINRFLGNFFGQVNLLKGLSVKSTFGADFRNRREGAFNGSVSSNRLGNPASASYRNNSGFAWTLQNQLTYSLTIAGAKERSHDLSFTAVQELRKERSEEYFISANNLSYESQKWYSLQNNSLGTNVVTGTYPPDIKFESYLGRVNYTYNSKYSLTASLRHDASSVLAEGNTGQYFPSASVAWKIDQEKFMKNAAFVDQLKLRVGYGAVGQSGISPGLTRGTLGASYYNFGGTIAQGYSPTGLAYPTLTWERTKTKNLGVDFGFFSNRLSGSIDIYESNSNQIQRENLPGASGVSFAFVNLGRVNNKGLEVALSTVNMDKSANKGGFKWTTDFAFSTNKEAIEFLTDANVDNVGSQWFLGQPVRNFNDFRSQGIFQYSDTEDGGILKDYFWKKAGNKTNPNFQPGKIRVQDINGDTVITDVDKVNLGSPNPKWTGSINNTFSFKGFDLSAFVYVSHGSLVRDFRPGLVGRYPGPQVNYWTPTNPSNDYQQPDRGSDIPLYWQALSFRDGSFVRVRSILLAYHIPQSLLSKVKVSNMVVSLNAVNPFLFSKFKRYDPETVPYTSTYPSSSTANPGPTSYSYKSFVLGLRMGL